MVQRGFPFSEKHPGNFRGICHIELAIKPMEQPQCGTAYNYYTREIVNWLALQNDDASWPYKQKWLCCFTLAIFKDKCRRKLFSSNKGFFVSHKRSAEMRSIFPQQQAPDNNVVYLVLEVLKKYIYIYIYAFIYYAHIRLVFSTNTKPCCQKWKCASRKYQNSLERSEISNRLFWNIFFKRPVYVLCDLFVFVLFW